MLSRLKYYIIKYITNFAFNQIINSIDSAGFNNQILIKKVNPAFTSLIGKIKYLRKYGLSIHQSASLVIARRGQNFKETIPPGLLAELSVSNKKKSKKEITNASYITRKAGRSSWANWGKLNKKIEKVNINFFYKNSLDSSCRYLIKLVSDDIMLLPKNITKV